MKILFGFQLALIKRFSIATFVLIIVLCGHIIAARAQEKCPANQENPTNWVWAKKNLTGMYRSPVSPSLLEKDTPEKWRYNYLAINDISTHDGTMRVLLHSPQPNGHDCGIDSRAKLCGRIIHLIPRESERESLKSREVKVPTILISKRSIKFQSALDGSVHFGPPYCGIMGSLDQSFSTNSKRASIEYSVFEQYEKGEQK